MAPQWVGGMKVCSLRLGHLSKMATIAIYGKNLLKIFFCGTKGPVALGHGMQHWGHGPTSPVKFEKNDNLEFTLIFLPNFDFLTPKSKTLKIFLSETRRPKPFMFGM